MHEEANEQRKIAKYAVNHQGNSKKYAIIQPTIAAKNQKAKVITINWNFLDIILQLLIG
jgi:hypothetical protein